MWVDEYNMPSHREILPGKKFKVSITLLISEVDFYLTLKSFYKAN